MTTADCKALSESPQSERATYLRRMMRFGGLVLALLAMIAAAQPSFAQGQRLKGDAERGAQLFRVCAPCHDLGRRARHKTGPGFDRIIGRQLIGTYDGYRSSLPMNYFGTLGQVWTPELLDLYLRNPEKFSVGAMTMQRSSTSPFIGVFDPQDRADIIAYIRANGTLKRK